MSDGSHHGSCHCGVIRFTVQADLEVGVMCDCSICKRKSAVMALIEPEQFKLETGQDNLSCYQFNTKLAEHYFCKTCGIYTHHKRRTSQGMGVNIGCLEGITANDLSEVKHFKGSELSAVDDADS